jgi:hypothetical protein
MILPFLRLETFLTKIFSEENKKEIKRKKMEKNIDIHFYFDIGNFIISVRFLSEWEREVWNLIRFIRTRQGLHHEPCLTFIQELCHKKKFFDYLGFGPLIQNIDFLETLMKEQKESKYSKALCQQFLGYLCPLEHQDANLGQENCHVDDMVRSMLILAYVSRSLSSKIKEIIINIMKECDFANSQLSTLQRNIGDAVKELPEMKSFLESYKTSRNREIFLSHWIYPPLPDDTDTSSQENML